MIHNLDALAERIQLGWKQLGCEEGLKARIVNYAEDFVILSVKKGEEAYEAMKTGRGCAVYPRRHSTTLATVLGDVIHQSLRAVVPIADIGCDSGCAPNTDRQGAVTRAYPDEYLYETLGLVRLAQTTRNFP